MILCNQEYLAPNLKLFDKSDYVRTVLAEIERFSFTDKVHINLGVVFNGFYLLQDDKCTRDAMLSNPNRVLTIPADLMLEFVLVQWARKSLSSIDCL